MGYGHYVKLGFGCRLTDEIKQAIVAARGHVMPTEEPDPEDWLACRFGDCLDAARKECGFNPSLWSTDCECAEAYFVKDIDLSYEGLALGASPVAQLETDLREMYAAEIAQAELEWTQLQGMLPGLPPGCLLLIMDYN